MNWYEVQKKGRPVLCLVSPAVAAVFSAVCVDKHGQLVWLTLRTVEYEEHGVFYTVTKK